MEATKNLLKALVVLPEVLRHLEAEKTLPRTEVKILLTIWLLTQTRMNVSTRELANINTTFRTEYIERLANRGLIESKEFKTDVKGANPIYYNLTGSGQAMIHQINSLTENILKQYDYLEELDRV